MKMKIEVPALLATLMAGHAAMASDPPPPRVGDDTRAWLQLQGSGNAATAAPRPMQGEVADKVYERYLKSFENQIPDEFERETFVSGGGGS